MSTTLAALGEGELRRRLSSSGLTLRLPPFVARLQSDVPRVAQDLMRLYGEFALGRDDEFADFHLTVNYDRGLHALWRRLAGRRQARFSTDGLAAFTTLPATQAFHMVEWGLNWAVTAHAHHFVVYHAAVLERGGRALVLPAPPGSGKSTLTAALGQRGWRLLSDELALLDPRDGQLYGLARPVNLKNQAIALMQAFAPGAVMTAPVPDTLKGTLSLMKAPGDAISRVHEGARPAWVVVPSFEPGAEAVLEALPKAQAHLLLADQAFNYDIHGVDGFEATADLVDRVDCWGFTYSRLDDAIAVFDRLAAES
ncbi:HprK-related kinase A [Roseateles sp. NT4]|uniref:HprK-related kinase A n=1 Tax=Roseateles sp. NT4 TaxID=3453715 RepID=UPI003EE97A3A